MVRGLANALFARGVCEWRPPDFRAPTTSYDAFHERCDEEALSHDAVG
jgi:hypothetical protein